VVDLPTRLAGLHPTVRSEGDIPVEDIPAAAATQAAVIRAGDIQEVIVPTDQVRGRLGDIAEDTLAAQARHATATVFATSHPLVQTADIAVAPGRPVLLQADTVQAREDTPRTPPRAVTATNARQVETAISSEAMLANLAADRRTTPATIIETPAQKRYLQGRDLGQRQLGDSARIRPLVTLSGMEAVVSAMTGSAMDTMATDAVGETASSLSPSTVSIPSCLRVTRLRGTTTRACRLT